MTKAAKRNPDAEIRQLRARLSKDPADAEAMRQLVGALLRVKDHRGLVALGARAIPFLKLAEEAMPAQPAPSPSALPGRRPVAATPLERRARVDLVRLELSILGPGAWIAARPLRGEGRPVFLITVDEVRPNRAGRAAIGAHPPGGGEGLLIPLEDVERVGEDARQAYELAIGGWRVARLSFAEGVLLEGWLRGQDYNGAGTWNGHAQPFMTLDQTRKFVEAWIAGGGNDPEGGFVIELVEEKDGPVLRATIAGNDEPEVVRATTVEGPGAPKEPVWDVSLGLVWDEEPPEGLPDDGD